jgi:3-hydroxybutyryl-CoA dehydratase
MSFTAMHLFFDDVEVGQQWDSHGRTVTEADIVNYAGLSGDFSPIHMDHVFAATTPFRAPIAHGLLVLSMGSGLMITAPLMRTIAFVAMKDWQFKHPVFIGDTIRARSQVLEKVERARGRRGLITWQRQLINQKDQVVQEGQTVTMVEGRASVRTGE